MTSDQYRITFSNRHGHPVGIGRDNFFGLIEHRAIPEIHLLGNVTPNDIRDRSIRAMDVSAVDIARDFGIREQSEVSGPVRPHADSEVFPTSAYIALHLIRVVEQGTPLIRITHTAGEGHHIEFTKSPSGYITNAYDLDGMLLTQNLPQR